MAELTLYNGLDDLIGTEVSYHDEDIDECVTEESTVRCKVISCYLQSESPFGCIYVCVELEPLNNEDIEKYDIIETGLDNIYVI